MTDYSEHLISMAGGDEDDVDPFATVETSSVYEVGSVNFLASLQHLSTWAEAGVPISGDKTLLHGNGIWP